MNDHRGQPPRAILLQKSPNDPPAPLATWVARSAQIRFPQDPFDAATVLRTRLAICVLAGLAIVIVIYFAASPGVERQQVRDDHKRIEEDNPQQDIKDDAKHDQPGNNRGDPFPDEPRFDPASLSRTAEWIMPLLRIIATHRTNQLAVEKQQDKIKDEFDRLKGKRIEWLAEVALIQRSRMTEKDMLFVALRPTRTHGGAVRIHILHQRKEVKEGGPFLVPVKEQFATLKQGDDINVAGVIDKVSWQLGYGEFDDGHELHFAVRFILTDASLNIN